jgi:hypothetical protein
MWPRTEWFPWCLGTCRRTDLRLDVTKLPLPSAAAVRPATASPAQPGSQSPAKTASIQSQADIRPLDIRAALQILLAEVRASFELPAAPMSGDGGVVLDEPTQAARAAVEMVLQSVPEGLDMAAWTAALLRAETALQTGLQRAIDAVAVWRAVPAAVVEATQETRTLVFAVLVEETQNPIWRQSEWAALHPRLERFWRRRRAARRRLTDPDYSSGGFDDDWEHRS